YEAVVHELLAKVCSCANPADLDEQQRSDLLSATLEQPLHVPTLELSDESREALALFRLLRRVVHAYGRQALGAHVVSMTRRPSDVLSVLWLWRHADADRAEGDQHAGSLEQTPPLPVVPLFETIDDLQRAGKVFEQLLCNNAYRRQLVGQANRQMIMLGYSDSTKDGGYLAACWSLYRCQRNLQEIASREEIDLTFFHGRGGALGRGGGPAARSILSLPAGTFHGSLRLTEQGEVLADRYDDPRIAYRHLEQIIWSALLASGSSSVTAKQEWIDTMERMSDRSFEAYRKLVDLPGFVEFFRRATPISEIEQMPIGSRPSRRRGGGGLSDLRAIPWVFSWTQSRCLIPAWFGFGSSMADMLDDSSAAAELRAMFRGWP
ncbi:MAG: phosphoenolpyruvate carboxylase, partial [Planctomycetota bacterium]